jgi:hypothetical protein
MEKKAQPASESPENEEQDYRVVHEQWRTCTAQDDLSLS